MNEGIISNPNHETSLIKNLHTFLKNKKIVSAISKKSINKHNLEPIPLRNNFHPTETKKQTTETSVQVQSNSPVVVSNSPLTISPIKSENKFSSKLDDIKSCIVSDNYKSCKSSKSSFSSNFNNIQSLIIEENRISHFTFNNLKNTENNFNLVRTSNNSIIPDRSKEFLTVRESIAEYEKRPIKSAFYSPKKYFEYKTMSQIKLNKKDVKYKDALMRFKKDNKHLYLRFNYFKNKGSGEGLGFNIANNGGVKINNKFPRNTIESKNRETLSITKKILPGYKSFESLKLKTK
jgi:hypothetical protein